MPRCKSKQNIADIPANGRINDVDLCCAYYENVGAESEEYLRLLFWCLGLLSLFSLIIIIKSIAFKQKNQDHHSKIILLICTIEGIYIWCAIIQTPANTAGLMACYWKLDHILGFSLRDSAPEY